MRKLTCLIFSISVMFTCYSIEGANFTFHQALEFFNKAKLGMPNQENDGQVPTLNKKGASSPQFDYATLQFLNFGKGKRLLEIGGAYGNVMLEALRHDPKTVYHLNDLDQRHLSIAAFRLQEKIEQRHICLDGLENVRFIYGDITQSTWEVKQPYDAILMARVIHFLSPQQIKNALSNLYKSLKPGGRIYIIALSPYVKPYELFIPEYERRLKKGSPYPGFVQNLKKYVKQGANPQNQLKTISGGQFMFMDTIVLPRLFKAAGFKIIECEFKPLSYSSATWELDGRENVILVAERPE